MTLIHPWKLLSYDSTDDGTVTRLMAAAVLDGIGVLASWTRKGDGAWSCRVVDTEGGAPRAEIDEEPVPAAPPIKVDSGPVYLSECLVWLPEDGPALQSILIRGPDGRRIGEFFRRWDR